MPAPSPTDAPISRTTNQARQGVTGQNVRTVLVLSMGAAIILLAVAGFLFLR